MPAKKTTTKKAAPKKSAAKKKAPAKKAEPTPNPAPAKCYVEITEGGTKIGAMIFAAGKRLNLPIDQAKALEAIGKGRIVGV